MAVLELQIDKVPAELTLLVTYDDQERSACKNKCVATEEKCVLKPFKKDNMFYSTPSEELR